MALQPEQLRGRVPALIGGKYEILAPLGSGGMSDVFKVRHVDLDAVRALKVLPHSPTINPEIVTRFRREAKKMATFRHEHIVKVYDFGRDHDLFYLVLDFVDGTTLAERLRTDGPLDVGEAVRIACEMADALVYAHALGVTHRDVKPSNILLERRPPQRALLIDFGIAKVDDDADHTRADVLLGTPRYSAPEQLGYRRGKARVEVDHRADVYALGLVLFEMLEGDALLADLTPAEIMMRVAVHPDPLRAAFTVPVPDAVRAIVDRAITRDPDGRFQTMQDMLAALVGCLPAEAPAGAGEPMHVPTGLGIEAIDAHIQALEAEKLQQLVRGAESTAERAEREASTADAPALAPDAWAEAGGILGRARDAARDGRLEDAREAYEAAALRFRQATGEAVARRREQYARLARDEMHAARAEADAAQATTWAPADLEAAIARETAADRAFDAGRHEDAQRGYVEARGAYATARSAAVAAERRARRDRVDQARASAADAGRRAGDAGAREWAASDLATAAAHLARADVLIASGMDAEAAEAFAEAEAAFARATDAATATRAAAHAAAEEARAELMRAFDETHGRHPASDLGADGLAAARLRDEGARALAGGAYGRALEQFEEAARLLRRAAEQADAARAARAQAAATAAAAAAELAVPKLPLVTPEQPPAPSEAPTWMMHLDGSPIEVRTTPATPSPPPVGPATPATLRQELPAEPPARAVVRVRQPPADAPAPRWRPAAVAAGLAALATLVYLTAGRTPTAPVAVAPGPAPVAEKPVAPNRPPVVASQSPAGARVALAEGEVARFEVHGHDPDGGPAPVTTWYVDGRAVGTGERWQLDPPSPSAATARHAVDAEVRNAAGATARTHWDVEVTARPPRIARAEPTRSRLQWPAGETRVVRAEATTSNAEPAEYEWTLDGGKPLRTTDGRYAVPADLRGEHRLEVAAVDGRGLRSETAAWTLLIEPNATASAPPPTAAPAPAPAPHTSEVAKASPPAPPPASKPAALTEADVRDWLGRVERAYETRDSRAIVDLGVVKPSQLTLLQQQIGRYQTLEVDIADAQITLDGARAVVSFTRTDRDETGRVLDLPRQKFRLERGPDGVTAQRID